MAALLELLDPAVVHLEEVGVIDSTQLGGLACVKCACSVGGGVLVDLVVVCDEVACGVGCGRAELLDLGELLVTVEAQVLAVAANLTGHQVGYDGLVVGALDVFTQGLLRNFPRQADRGASVFQLAMLDTGTITVVRVLGLFAQQAAADANLVDFAGLCFA